MRLSTTAVPGKHLVRLAVDGWESAHYLIEVPHEARCVVRFDKSAFNPMLGMRPPEITVG